MASITFIPENPALHHPPFAVDFKQFSPAAAKENLKVQDVAFNALRLIPAIFIAFAKASYVTLSYSGTSFKQNVLGFYGPWSRFHPPSDIYLAVFKVAFWLLGLAWCTTTMTVRLVIADLFPTSSDFLTKYAMAGLDVSHIKTKDLAIDVSGVPASVKVDDLAKIYASINFTDPNKPGYMAPASRQEYSTVFTVDDLKASLATFVTQVNGRVAFLGTPPAYDTPRLMAFYQHIENAVRFSIDKTNKDLENFKAKNGEGPFESITAFKAQHGEGPYAEDLAARFKVIQEYNGLLENQARVAIDLAIAGKHCGARYMGEAMSVYGNAKGDILAHNGTLQDSICTLLARKRYEIAMAQIEKYLGVEQIGAGGKKYKTVDTHAYNKYMANLGSILALPGSENIIEHLDTSFDRDLFLRRFFEEYTIDVIIETIQAEVKKSQAFREKITDWVRDYPNEWKRGDYEAAANELVPQLLSQLSPESGNPTLNNAVQFHNLVEHLKGSHTPLPVFSENFVADLFELVDVKRLLGTEFAALHPLVRARKCETLKSLCLSVRLDIDDDEPSREVAALDALDEAVMRKAKADQSRQNIALLQGLFGHLDTNKVVLPSLDAGWDEFINELFTSGLVKQWRDATLTTLTPVQRQQKVTELRQLCSTPAPSEEELKVLKTKKGAELLAALLERANTKLIINKVRSILPLEEDTALRVMKDHAKAQDAVADKLEQARHIEFFEAFKLDRIHEQGISPALMEWMTVSQGIFNAQEVRGVK